MYRTCVFLVFCALLVAAAAAAQPSLGKPFDLKVGESVVVDGLTVGFDRILGDSRCPIGVYCIWEGDAAGNIWLRLPERDKQEFDLHTHRSFQWKVTYDGYVVALINIAPYPYYEVPIPPEDYVVTLRVNGDAAPARESTWGRIKALYHSN
jgi:hypothetical protein